MALTRDLSYLLEVWFIVSGSKKRTGVFIKAFALFGGGWVLILAFYATFVQFDLGSVLQGQIPVGIAFSLGKDALPVMVLLFFLGFATIGLALHRNKKAVLTGLIWIVIGGVLFYGVYLARFSIGIFLIPSAVTILISGLVTLWKNVF